MAYFSTPSFLTIPDIHVGISPFLGKQIHEYVEQNTVKSFIQHKIGISYKDSKKGRHRHVAKRYDNEQQQIIKYDEQYNDELQCFDVNYFIAKHGYGRIEPIEGLSLSKFRRPTRHAFSKKNYVDIDMVCAHHAFFVQAGDILNLKNRALKAYIQSPKSVRTEIMKRYNLDKDIAKELPIVMCFGKSLKKWMAEYTNGGAPWLDIVVEMEEELLVIGKKICELNPKIQTALKEYDNVKYGDENKLYKATVALWAQTVERLCQERAICWLVDKKGLKIEDVVPCQDGFMILNEFNYPNIVNDIENAVETQIGWKVKFAIKPFDEAIEIPPFDSMLITQLTFADLYPSAMSLICELSDDDFATMVYKLTEHNILLVSGVYYVYYKREWTQDDKGLIVKHIITGLLTKYIPYALSVINRELYMTTDEKTIETLKGKEKLIKKHTNKLNSMTFVKLVFEKMACILASKTHKTAFNVGRNNDYLIHFANGVYDIFTRTFRSRSRFDYTTKRLDYDYVPAYKIPSEKFDYINNIFRQIQPDDEQRRFQLSFLAYCLTADASLQKFKMNVGYTGGNGKSTELAIHEICFPIYTMKLQKDFFKKGFKNRHKFMNKLSTNSIRLSYVEELPARHLDVDFIKNWVDGRNDDIEMLYGNTIAIRYTSKIITNSQFDPVFGGDVDGGLKRRGLMQQYESRFVDEGKPICEDAHIYRKDLKIDSRMKDDDLLKNAYFHILLEHLDVNNVSNVFIPSSSEQLFADTVDSSNPVPVFIEDNFVITNDPDDKVSKDYIQSILPVGVEYGSVVSHLAGIPLRFVRDRQVDNKKGVWIGIKKVSQQTIQNDVNLL